MKLQLVALPLSALLLAGTGAAAQNAATADTKSTAAGNVTPANNGDRVALDNATERAWERTHRASKIIGTNVRNRQGQKIGDIKDVVLGPNGQIAYTVVSTGGFLGVGDRLHAIPWTALQTEGQSDFFVLDMDKERLKKAPGFDSKHWPNMAEERWNTDTRTYYTTPNR